MASIREGGGRCNFGGGRCIASPRRPQGADAFSPASRSVHTPDTGDWTWQSGVWSDHGSLESGSADLRTGMFWTAAFRETNRYLQGGNGTHPRRHQEVGVLLFCLAVQSLAVQRWIAEEDTLTVLYMAGGPSTRIGERGWNDRARTTYEEDTGGYTKMQSM